MDTGTLAAGAYQLGRGVTALDVDLKLLKNEMRSVLVLNFHSKEKIVCRLDHQVPLEENVLRSFVAWAPCQFVIIS